MEAYLGNARLGVWENILRSKKVRPSAYRRPHILCTFFLVPTSIWGGGWRRRMTSLGNGGRVMDLLDSWRKRRPKGQEMETADPWKSDSCWPLPLFWSEMIYRDALLLVFDIWGLREADSSHSRWEGKLPFPPHLAIILVTLLTYWRFMKPSLCLSHLKDDRKSRESF